MSDKEEVAKVEKKPLLDWSKIDDPLKRTGVILGIILGSLTLLTNYIAPNLPDFRQVQDFLLCLQAADVAWTGYRRWKNPLLFVGERRASMLLGLIICFVQTAIYLANDINSLRGNLWAAVGCGWVGLYVLATFDYEKNLREAFKAVYDQQIQIAESLATAMSYIAGIPPWVEKKLNASAVPSPSQTNQSRERQSADGRPFDNSSLSATPQ